MACQASIKRLVSGGSSCYLWTLTVPEDGLPVREVSRRWHSFSVELVREFHVSGVRVFELHPGGHGWHIHFVVPSGNRLPVRRVREISTRLGFGRIHVKRIPAEAAVYIAKYLGKGFNRGELGKGVRLWSPFGSRFSAVKFTRVRDVECLVDGAPAPTLFREVSTRLFGRPSTWTYREFSLVRSLVALISAGILVFSVRLGFCVSSAWPEFCNLDGVPVLFSTPENARRFVGLVNVFGVYHDA